MIRIVEADASLLDKAEKLVAKVFPWRDLPERMSFWAYRRQNNPIVRMLMRRYDVSSLLNIWVAVSDNGDVCGTTGLYTCPSDEDEAVWLSWFCVDPDHRGQGIGKKLIEFSIARARECNKKFLRLYTSDDPIEVAAQGLYEKYGFKIVEEEKHASHTIMYRELKL